MRNKHLAVICVTLITKLLGKINKEEYAGERAGVGTLATLASGKKEGLEKITSQVNSHQKIAAFFQQAREH